MFNPAISNVICVQIIGRSGRNIKMFTPSLQWCCVSLAAGEVCVVYTVDGLMWCVWKRTVDRVRSTDVQQHSSRPPCSRGVVVWCRAVVVSGVVRLSLHHAQLSLSGVATKWRSLATKTLMCLRAETRPSATRAQPHATHESQPTCVVRSKWVDCGCDDVVVWLSNRAKRVERQQAPWRAMLELRLLEIVR